ncbi:hypothetical protein OAC00_04705 [Amylibacter sp.]|nr:hypothetical protein [Amylibacter sp.]
MPDNLVYIENNGSYFLAGDGNRYYIINHIGYNLNTLESNGNYSLAEGAIYNQYYIFDRSDSSIVTNFVNSNMGNGWSATLVEAGSESSTFEVFWSNGGRSRVTSINNN